MCDYIVMNNNVINNGTRRAVFMMGGPASGKSTIRRRYFDDLMVLDCDSIKETHPDYDPKNPQALHAWSAAELKARVDALLNNGPASISFVYDGTGSTAERYVNYIQRAKAAGYHVILVYVKVDIEVAIARNANRERVVPEHVVRDKHSLIATSFEIVSPHADRVMEVNNN